MSPHPAKPWFKQAESDLRTAYALRAAPDPMRSHDVGCHVAAMCAQVIEKSIKGYVIVNGSRPILTHRPDKYLTQLLTKGDPLLRHTDHFNHLSKLFDQATKSRIGDLLELTPGGLGKKRTDVPNTEYPWEINGAWKETPAGSEQFNDSFADELLKLSKRILDTLHKLMIAVSRGPEL